jgi:hypothetical protein
VVDHLGREADGCDASGRLCGEVRCAVAASASSAEHLTGRVYP